MTQTLEISDDLKERLDNHCEDGQSNEELIEELVSMYETEGPSCRRGIRSEATSCVTNPFCDATSRRTAAHSV